jgi:hypothetical protein
MTDPNTEISTPTTNDELGVVGAQLAAAEARRNPDTPVTPTVDDAAGSATLRSEALAYATRSGGMETPEDVVKRATAYENYLRGASDD